MSSVFLLATKNWVTKANQSKQERNLEEEKQVFGPAIQQLSDANNLCQSKIFKLLICVVYVTFLVICRVYSFKKSNSQF